MVREPLLLSRQKLRLDRLSTVLRRMRGDCHCTNRSHTLHLILARLAGSSIFTLKLKSTSADAKPRMHRRAISAASLLQPINSPVLLIHWDNSTKQDQDVI